MSKIYYIFYRGPMRVEVYLYARRELVCLHWKRRRRAKVMVSVSMFAETVGFVLLLGMYLPQFSD